MFEMLINMYWWLIFDSELPECEKMINFVIFCIIRHLIAQKVR